MRDLTPTLWAGSSSFFFLWLALGVESTSGKIGGPPQDFAVCVDETFFTKRKKLHGGWQERFTSGHKTIIMAGVEIDLRTRT